MISAKAHANIALIKYWGKVDNKLFLPATSSLSLTLDALSTMTTVEGITGNQDEFILDGQIQDAQTISRFVDLFRKSNQALRIVSHNNFPTAAGLASSASGYAALAMALNKFFNLNLDLKELSKLTRQGSGSASRSLYGGFAVWQKGDHDTSFAYPLELDMDIEMVVVLINKSQKKKSSRSLMKETVEESRYFEPWVKQNELDLEDIIDAIKRQDIHDVGKIAQRNAMMMHGTLLANDNPFFYFEPLTIRAIQIAQDLQEAGLAAYYTMDAGPNVKIITNSNSSKHVLDVYRLAGFEVIHSTKGPGAMIL